MELQDEALVKKHLETDGELRDLWGRHLQYEQQLKKMEAKPFLSSEEKIEKKRLQLAKLTGKTRIEEILSKYRSA